MRFYTYKPRDADPHKAVYQVIDIARIVGGYYKIAADNLKYIEACAIASEFNRTPPEDVE